MQVKTCSRCDSKIVEKPARPPDYLDLIRRDGDTWETNTVELCSMCWNDLWEWALGDDTPDRSDQADPLPLERMADSVESHIEALDNVLSDLNEAGAEV